MASAPTFIPSSPFTSSRLRLPHSLCPSRQPRCFPRPRVHASPLACLPSRATDARGFVLPEEGDVILFAGRWAGEDALGLVSSLRYVSSRQSHVVDIVQLRRVGSDLFAVPGVSARRGKPARWLDVADVRIAADATYVPGQDAYRVSGTNDGYAKVKPLDAQARMLADGEYRKLKAELLRETLAMGVAGTAAAALGVGVHGAGAFAAGAAASAVYLAMLQAGVDSVGKGGLPARLLAFRFLVPVLPFVGLGWAGGALAGGVDSLVGSVSKADALAVVLGLLTYKVPLFTRTASEFVDGLADFEMGKTGMVGTVAGLAARQIKKRRASTGEDEEEVLEEELRPLFVFAGPSGVGKSTLIHRLMDEYQGRFEFSVSHTTRHRREGEEDGVDYHFIGTEEFERMIEEDAFVEHACVHGNYYGTSYQAVNAVLSEANICILDLDVQGVEALRSKRGLNWDARFIWIAPPSIAALEERLRGRGTETPETLRTRVDTTTRELSYAATSNVFDLTVINTDVNEAYEELRNYINQTTPPE